MFETIDVKRTTLLNSELTTRIVQGDKVAFELLFKMYHKPLCNFARVYVNQFHIADEIVQETFISIWKTREQLNPSMSINAYLYRCVHNNCVNYLYKARVDKRLSDAYRNEIEYRARLLDSDFSDSFYDNLANDELEFIINKAIEQLPTQCREIFLLSRYQELSYQQIAEKLGLSKNTIKTQLSRALQKIRDAMEKM